MQLSPDGLEKAILFTHSFILSVEFALMKFLLLTFLQLLYKTSGVAWEEIF
jgi:hypothetical protein